MTLLEVLYESMKVLKVDTAACVIATLEKEIHHLATGTRDRRIVETTHQLIFAFHGGKRVENRASVRLYGGRYLSCITEVGGAKRGMNG